MRGSGQWKVGTGLSLVEVLVVVAVIGVVLTVTGGAISDAARAAALNGAAARMHGLLFRCRAFAVMNGYAHAVVFEKNADGSWRTFIATDGDGDGIRRSDIRALIDPIVGEVLRFEAAGAGLGILQSEFVPDPSGRGRLRGDLSDPVRAGRGDIITFNPRSTATPCSIYFTDNHSRMRVLRVYGGTGRVMALVWRSGWNEWRRSGM
jgi:type II secretory pathway pseudopilin PulG